jgi:hypothetical protein
MTVIFQLFCADDLKMLGDKGREELRDIILKVLDPDAAQMPTAQMPTSRKPLELSTENNTRLKISKDTPRQAIEPVLSAIKKRFDEVSQEVESTLPSNPSSSRELRPSEDLLPQLRSMQQRTAIPSAQAKQEILEWAISCEVNNFNFYYPLLLIKEKAYRKFFERTGQRPKGPNSLYSPFHPRHPLYESFSDLKLDPNP